MLKALFRKYTLFFKRPSGTSRGVLTTKDSWFIKVWDSNNPDIYGIGECSIIYGLSPDPREHYEQKLSEVISNINNIESVDLTGFPSIKFGLETAFIDLKTGGKRTLFETEFTENNRPISINGLVWMGDYGFMREQIIEKVNGGFDCIKLKIGAIDFEKELELLKLIRQDFKEKELELRVDANGAFTPEEALEKLKILSEFHIHSIEQPIKAGQWDKMSELCSESPVHIALDEELIGLSDEQIRKMLNKVKPRYVILKPSLIGGISRSEFIIQQANGMGIGWWNTSALESNIGLNAIAQWTATLNNKMPQGLGTGQLYTNNIPSPLTVKAGKLFFEKEKKFWDLSFLEI